MRAPPRHRNNFTVVPFGTEEESVKRDKGKAGVAAVLFRGNTVPKSLQYHFGSLDKHTTFKVEAVRLILGTNLLSVEPHPSTVTISSNSQAALLALNICNPLPRQQLIDEFLHASRHVHSLDTPGNYSLELTWVKGHKDSIGNGLVDEEAWATTADNTNLVADLPSFLSSAPLPISSLASKQKYMQELKVWWKDSWACSPRFPKLSKINPTMPSNKFQKLIAGLGRAQASLVTQMRTRHIPLNAYLHRINKIDTPLCPSCSLDSESVHHFLFDCQVWRAEHWCMGKALGCKAKSLWHVVRKES